jgi:uncharacterized membrane protein YphA (DoxX/SURF4 family)
MNSPFLANICLFLVGSVFLLTGIAKVVEPWKFFIHIRSYGLLPPRWVRPVSLAFIALETALGIALIFPVFPRFMIAVSLLLLAGISALNYWSTSTGKTEDCGCYNGWLQISPTVSLLLNVFYSILLIAAWIFLPDRPTVFWQCLLAIATLIVSGALASGSFEYLGNYGSPYFDFTRIVLNRPWQSQWLDNAIDVSTGSKLLVFLDTGCSQCKNWLRVLKVVHNRPDLPEVVGVVSTATLALAQEYAETHALNFPVVTIKRSLFGRLAISVPTAAVLENGVIQEKWVMNMPEAFVKKIASGSMAVPKGTGQVVTAAEK